MVDETAKRGGLSIWQATFNGRDLPDISLPFQLDPKESHLTPGQEVYKFSNSVFTGDLVHNNWQDPARPNDWSLFVQLKDDGHVFLKCAEHSARSTVPPPSLKDMAKSQEFDCKAEGTEDRVFPTSGHAHVHVDAEKMQVVTTLSNLNVNGLDHKTVTLTYPLKSYFPGNSGRPTVLWAPSENDSGSLGPKMDNPDEFQMMTNIPGGWPSWMHTNSKSMNPYGVFVCRMTNGEQGVTAAEAPSAAAKADAAANDARMAVEKDAQAKAKIEAERAQIEAEAKAKVRAQIEADLRAKAVADATAKAEADAKADIEAAEKAKDKAAADAKAAAEARMEAEAIARHDDEVRKDKEAAETKAREDARMEAEAAARNADNLRAASAAREASIRADKEAAEVKASEEARIAAEAKAAHNANVREANAKAEAAARFETENLNKVRAHAERTRNDELATFCNHLVEEKRMLQRDLANHYDQHVVTDRDLVKQSEIYCDVLRQRGKGYMIHGG